MGDRGLGADRTHASRRERRFPPADDRDAATDYRGAEPSGIIQFTHSWPIRWGRVLFVNKLQIGLQKKVYATLV